MVHFERKFAFLLRQERRFGSHRSHHTRGLLCGTHRELGKICFRGWHFLDLEHELMFWQRKAKMKWRTGWRRLLVRDTITWNVPSMLCNVSWTNSKLRNSALDFHNICPDLKGRAGTVSLDLQGLAGFNPFDEKEDEQLTKSAELSANRSTMMAEGGSGRSFQEMHAEFGSYIHSKVSQHSMLHDAMQDLSLSQK